MASAGHHARYQQPQASSSSDFRLPSLKDLNFHYQSPPTTQGSLSIHPGAAAVDPPPPHQENSGRHIQAWGRTNPSPSVSSSLPPHQQHTPPLSAGHDSAPKVEYPSKHENGGYVHPGIPLSAQATPIQGTVSTAQPTRSDESLRSPNQSKRARTSSANMNVPRDIRPSHTAYTPQYASYPQTSQPPSNGHYHQIPQSLSGHAAAPPSHEQIHHHPVPISAHPGYAPYQQAYIQTRAPMHPQHTAHTSQPNHSNPYPSPGPPSAPPPQGPWGQTQPQHQHPHHQHMTPVSQQPQSLPPPPPPPPPPQPQHGTHAHAQPQQQTQPSHTPQSHMVPQHHPQTAQMPPSQQQQLQHAHQTQQAPQAQTQQQPQQQMHHPAQPPPPQPSQMHFARTTPLVPTNVDARTAYAPSEPERPVEKNETLSEIFRQCSTLYGFASRYAQIQATLPHAEPTPTELADMSQRAKTVVRLLEEFRRLNLPPAERAKIMNEPIQTSPDDIRPPKRPWEDMSQDNGAPMQESPNFVDQYPSTADKTQTTAEQDMEMIRTKRATSTAGGNGSAGQPKSKYRKRSRATPPGKCHSCNIRETPEWRRGPDGARTLCNACGLHYAKMMRRKDKNNDIRIDMDTLRASARAAENSDKSRSSKGSKANQSIDSDTTMEVAKQPPQHHQGSFQLVNMMAPEPTTAMSAEPPRVPQQMHNNVPNTSNAMTAPPPWATGPPPSSTPVNRGYAPDQLQHQSFMRSSQHPSASHNSSR